MSVNKAIQLLFAAFIVLLSSCQPSQEQMLCKKWKTVGIYNNLLDKQIAAGIDGVVVGGSTGEGSSLAQDEYNEL